MSEKQKTRRPNTYKNHKYRLATHFNFKGQLADISHHEVARRLAKISTLIEQDHALSVAKTFFTWCHNRRYIDDNPCRGLSPHGSQSRSRVLNNSELKAVWFALDDLDNDLPLHFRRIVKLLILARPPQSNANGNLFAETGNVFPADFLLVSVSRRPHSSAG